MRIESGTIGNYSPYSANKVQTSVQAKQQEKTDQVTKEEKDFFTKLYPENKTEILDYHFYKSSGKMSGVSLGSLFDKRG